ncbi:MAG: hypothetical protein NMNS02_30740 [Nitrosomonas sp.]|nr:MAG: hypothetical protein NMNS02_30740 [Nitrosomonas sp.]
MLTLGLNFVALKLRHIRKNTIQLNNVSDVLRADIKTGREETLPSLLKKDA